MTPPTPVSQLIRDHRDELSPAERRVADVVVADPQFVAFGTVAELAARAGTSGASVLRLASRLDLDGFTALQEQVRTELTRHLHRAAERIHRPAADDLLGQATIRAVEQLQGTLGAIRSEDFQGAVALLADDARQVFVLASEASHGIGDQFAAELAMVRPGVDQVGGSPVAVHRALADLEPDAVVVALDLPRYDAWLLEAITIVRERGAAVLALTDSQLSPLAVGARLVFVVDGAGVGPFDSHVSALALLEALVAGVATARRASAAEHLARIEAAWVEAEVLRED